MEETERPKNEAAQPSAKDAPEPMAVEEAAKTPAAETADEESNVGVGTSLTPPLSRGEREEDAEVPPEVPPPAKPSPPVRRRISLAEKLREAEEIPIELPASKVRARTRRDFLLFGAGAIVAAGGLWWLLPDGTKRKHLTPGLQDWIDSLEARLGANPESRERFLNRVLTFDDDVAEALYSPDRSVRTYSKSQVTPLRNNYEGMTPDPDYIPDWTLTVSGLASGRVERLAIADLLTRSARHDQVTRLCCVEGCSMVAWWGGLRFADLLRAYPPAPGSRCAPLDSAVNLDSA